MYLSVCKGQSPLLFYLHVLLGGSGITIIFLPWAPIPVSRSLISVSFKVLLSSINSIVIVKTVLQALEKIS